jgi:hypothetical protein
MTVSLAQRAVRTIEAHPLALSLGLGLLVRCIHLNGRSLQYDDTFSIFLAQRNLPEIVRGTAADTMPPLFYFVLHYWMLLGQSVWFLRSLSLLLSLAAVALLFMTVKEMYGTKIAGWAAFLAAISPFQFYHAQDIRNYALLLCTQLGMLWFFVRLWKKDEQGGRTSPWDWVGLVGCGAASMYVHNAAILAMFIPNLFLLLKRRWRLFFRLALAQAVIGILSIPWLLQVPGQVAKVQHAWWQSPPGLIEVVQVPIYWVAGLPLPGVRLLVGALLSLECLVLVVLETIRGRKNNPGLLLLGCVTLVFPIILFALSYIIQPVFVPRTFILSSMAFYGLAAWVIGSGWGRGVGKILLAGFVAAAVIGLPAQATFEEFPRSPFREAAAEITRTLQPGEMVIHDNKLSYFPCHFYQPGLAQTFLPDVPGSGNDTFARASQEAMQIFPAQDLQSAAGDYKGIYFVTFSRTLQEYSDLGYPQHPSIDWLSQHYRLKEHKIYGDLEVFHFTRP